MAKTTAATQRATARKAPTKKKRSQGLNVFWVMAVIATVVAGTCWGALKLQQDSDVWGSMLGNDRKAHDEVLPPVYRETPANFN